MQVFTAVVHRVLFFRTLLWSVLFISVVIINTYLKITFKVKLIWWLAKRLVNKTEHTTARKKQTVFWNFSRSIHLFNSILYHLSLYLQLKTTNVLDLYITKKNEKINKKLLQTNSLFFSWPEVGLKLKSLCI